MATMHTPLPLALLCAACATPREDGAQIIEIDAGGSLQNACWSPDGARLLFTIWQGGYNRGAAAVAVVDAGGGEPEVLTSGDGVHVNLPGACWVGDAAVYSSDESDRDEIIVRDMAAGVERQITDRSGLVAYEPTLSPDGAWVAFESHVDEEDSPGEIWKIRVDGTDPVQLTAGGDDREPNWSPTGDRIVFQRLLDGDWDIWTIDADGGDPVNVTDATSEDTDPSWSPDGGRILYSSDRGELDLASLFVIDADGGTPTRVTRADRYDGAPSWSPDGLTLAFESADGDPDRRGETTLWTIPAP